MTLQFLRFLLYRLLWDAKVGHLNTMDIFVSNPGNNKHRQNFLQNWIEYVWKRQIYNKVPRTDTSQSYDILYVSDCFSLGTSSELVINLNL